MGREHNCFVRFVVVDLFYYYVHKDFCCRCEGFGFSDVGCGGFQGVQVETVVFLIRNTTKTDEITFSTEYISSYQKRES